MYRSPRIRRRHQVRYSDYLLPFLILVAIGVIVVLLFKLWNFLFSDDSDAAAYMHIVEGSVEMKAWGTDDFFDISADALIVAGDELVTSANAKVIVEFFDGTIMRLDGSTDVIFEEIDGDAEAPLISVILVDGNAWFNKVYIDSAGLTALDVKLSDAVVNADLSSIFEVESGIDKYVRVIDGEDVRVDILDQDGRKIVADEEVGIGQEVMLNDAAMQRFWSFQSPNVVMAASENFKLSAWYLWNAEEDKNPTEFEKAVNGKKFVKAPPEEVKGEEEDLEKEADTESLQIEGEELSPEAAIGDNGVAVPTIISVAGGNQTNADGFYVVQSNPAVIHGGVSGAVKIVVNDFVLQKFNPGDSTWTYYANADYGLMKAGENVYQVYAYDAAGGQSAALTVKVLYQPPAAPAQTGAGETEPAQTSETTESQPEENTEVTE